jgi:hypothetical protein
MLILFIQAPSKNFVLLLLKPFGGGYCFIVSIYRTSETNGILNHFVVFST